MPDRTPSTEGQIRTTSTTSTTDVDGAEAGREYGFEPAVSATGAETSGRTSSASEEDPVHRRRAHGSRRRARAPKGGRAARVAARGRAPRRPAPPPRRRHRSCSAPWPRWAASTPRSPTSSGAETSAMDERADIAAGRQHLLGQLHHLPRRQPRGRQGPGARRSSASAAPRVLPGLHRTHAGRRPGRLHRAQGSRSTTPRQQTEQLAPTSSPSAVARSIPPAVSAARQRRRSPRAARCSGSTARPATAHRSRAPRCRRARSPRRSTSFDSTSRSTRRCSPGPRTCRSSATTRSRRHREALDHRLHPDAEGLQGPGRQRYRPHRTGVRGHRHLGRRCRRADDRDSVDRSAGPMSTQRFSRGQPMTHEHETGHDDRDAPVPTPLTADETAQDDDRKRR